MESTNISESYLSSLISGDVHICGGCKQQFSDINTFFEHKRSPCSLLTTGSSELLNAKDPRSVLLSVLIGNDGSLVSSLRGTDSSVYQENRSNSTGTSSKDHNGHSQTAHSSSDTTSSSISESSIPDSESSDKTGPTSLDVFLVPNNAPTATSQSATSTVLSQQNSSSDRMPISGMPAPHTQRRISAERQNHPQKIPILYKTLDTVDKRYKCEYTACNYTTSYLKDLHRHFRIHTGERPFKCQHCGRSFTRSDKLKIHERNHSGEKPYKCSLCPYAATEHGSLKKHIRIHTDERPFKCQICPYASRSSSQLIVHLRTHTGDTPFYCSVCGTTFKISSDLKRHMRMHTGEKPYKCDLCSYSSAAPGNLKTHKRVNHSTENMQTCSKCNFSTPSRKAMQLHAREHNMKMLNCPHCTYSSSTRSLLKNHMKIHTDTKQYQCPLCCYKSRQYSHLLSHLSKKHPEKLTKTVQTSRAATDTEIVKSDNVCNKKKSSGKRKITSKPACHKSFCCTLCDAAFVREDSLKSHLKQHRERSSEGAALAMLQLRHAFEAKSPTTSPSTSTETASDKSASCITSASFVNSLANEYDLATVISSCSTRPSVVNNSQMTSFERLVPSSASSLLTTNNPHEVQAPSATVSSGTISTNALTSDLSSGTSTSLHIDIPTSNDMSTFMPQSVSSPNASPQSSPSQRLSAMSEDALEAVIRNIQRNNIINICPNGHEHPEYLLPNSPSSAAISILNDIQKSLQLDSPNLSSFSNGISSTVSSEIQNQASPLFTGTLTCGSNTFTTSTVATNPKVEPMHPSSTCSSTSEENRIAWATHGHIQASPSQNLLTVTTSTVTNPCQSQSGIYTSPQIVYQIPTPFGIFTIPVVSIGPFGNLTLSNVRGGHLDSDSVYPIPSTAGMFNTSPSTIMQLSGGLTGSTTDTNNTSNPGVPFQLASLQLPSGNSIATLITPPPSSTSPNGLPTASGISAMSSVNLKDLQRQNEVISSTALSTGDNADPTHKLLNTLGSTGVHVITDTSSVGTTNLLSTSDLQTVLQPVILENLNVLQQIAKNSSNPLQLVPQTSHENRSLVTSGGPTAPIPSISLVSGHSTKSPVHSLTTSSSAGKL